MADRQRSFADMFSDITGSLTQGAQWKRAMKPSTEKERARLLPQETREWMRGQQRKQWLDTEGDKYRFDPKTGKMISRKEFEMMRPSEFPIKEVADYLMMLDPRRSMMKGFQKFVLPKLSKMTRRRQKRQMKEAGEMRPEPNPTAVEALEAHEQVSDRMGYNPTDWYVGEPRSPEDHSQDLAGRFLQFLRDKDARAIDPSTVPDPDVNLNAYIRDVSRRGEEEARRREAGLPPTRRRESDRFKQVDTAMRNRYESMNDAVIDRLPSDFQSSALGEPSSKPSQSIMDLLSRTMGRKLSRDKPSIKR